MCPQSLGLANMERPMTSPADAEFKGTRHWRSMALDTLPPEESHKKFERPRRNSLQPCSLTTEGIDLARPAPVYRFLNRGSHKFPGLSKTWDDIDKPRPWVPANVNRSFNNLTVDDIKGARPEPKNMKLGNAARGTNPLDPVYKLPVVEEPPPFEPKFLRDNLKVDDIPGAQIQPRVRFNMNSKSEVIEGSFVGWRPTHRKKFGKTTRDLCLHVQDINRPSRRMVRDVNSSAYLEIEGTHPKQLKQYQVQRSRENHILQNHDIKGTEVGSRTLPFNVIRKKNEGQERATIVKQHESAEPIALEILETKIQDCGKELGKVFKEMDRDSSGKLTVDEVHTALEKVNVDLNPSEMKSLTSAFDTSIDGFVDYPKMLQFITPSGSNKHNLTNKFDSHIVSLCFNQWIEKPLPRSLVRNPNIKTLGKNFKVEKDAPSKPCSRESVTKKEVVNNGQGKKNEIVRTSLLLPSEMGTNGMKRTGAPFYRENSKFPLEIGLKFWPDEKTIYDQQPKPCMSLLQDYNCEPDVLSRPVDEDEKQWEGTIGGMTFTGEGNIVHQGSHMHGYNWSRPASTDMHSRKRRQFRSQSQTGFSDAPEVEGRPSTARNDYLSSSKASNSIELAKRPMTAGVTQVGRKFGTPKQGSPRSSAIFGGSFDCTPRGKEFIGSSISSRQSLASRNQTERILQRLQTVKREDAAAVRSLI